MDAEMPLICRSIRPLLTCTVWLWLAHNVSQAETYRHPIQGFTLELPSGWRMMSTAELGSINSMLKFQDAKRLDGQPVQFDAGFQPIAESESSPAIVILFDKRDLSRATSAEIGRFLGSRDLRHDAEKMGNELVKRSIDSVEFGNLVWDTKLHRATLRTKTVLPLVGTERGLVTLHASQSGFVMIKCVAEESEFPECLPVFEAVNDSLKMAPGQEYQPPVKNENLNGRRARDALVSAAIASAVVAFVFSRLKRRKPRLDQPPEPPAPQ
jgi:hypothetical protein